MSIQHALFFVGRIACRSSDRVVLSRLWTASHCPHSLARFISSSGTSDHSPPSQQHDNTDRKRVKFGRLTLSKEIYERKKTLIEAQTEEKVPEKFFAKLHYYFKRYWYIALPVHTAVCAVWFACLYFAVKSGLDTVALMEHLHLPDHWVDKVRNVPPSAGFMVAALILYKIATPLRYACTLLGIRVAFSALRRWGKLRTTHELDLAVRRRLYLLMARQRWGAKKATRPLNGNGRKQSSLSSSRTRTKLD